MGTGFAGDEAFLVVSVAVIVLRPLVVPLTMTSIVIVIFEAMRGIVALQWI